MTIDSLPWPVDVMCICIALRMLLGWGTEITLFDRRQK